MKFTEPYPDHLYTGEIPPSEQPDVEPYAGGTRFERPFPHDQQPLQTLGLLDVTRPPFSADSTGNIDCTAALNEAIRTAQRYHFVCYFPLGTYLISDTLEARQYIWWDGYPYDKYRIVQRTYPVVMMGERREENGATLRPTIRLAPHSEGFRFRDAHKPVIDVYNGPASGANAAPASIENMITGLHIEIGEGNVGAIGVRFYAAQGCSIEDCVIDAGDGYCGIWGAAGNGGSHAQNVIRGGRVGMDLSRGTPGSVMSGFVFDHQREHAIIAGTKQAADFVGCEIRTSSQLPPVVSFGGGSELFHQGQISLIDCTIEFDAPMPAGRVQTAVSSRESLYLRNVYVRNATHFVWNPDGSRLAAPSQAWCRAEEFAHGVSSMPHEGRVYPSAVYLDGQKLPSADWSGKTEPCNPPPDLLEKHRYRLPLWQDVLDCNVKERFGAAGDGIADDTKALQRAIDESEYVFLPKGYYRITDTLRLRPDTKLVGVAQGLSQILVTQTPDGAFAEGKDNVPALDTPDCADASVTLVYCGVVTSRKQPKIYALRWRVAGRSLLRNFAFYADVGYRITWITAQRNHPWILVTGNGGGRWFNFWCDITQGGQDYRILRIQGTRQPFAIYACNPEHSRSDYEMDILNSRNVVIYNLKSECNTPNLLIRDSENIAVFSQGGDATTYPGGALYHIENSADVTLTLLYDYRINCSGHGPEYFSGTWFDPCQWHMLTETSRDGAVTTTPPCERPCLYKRGEFRDCF